jgi:WD40 repeat protein
MTRSIFAVLVVASCGHPAAPIVERVGPAKPSAPPRPQLRTDRPAIHLGGPPSWGTATDVVSLRFCPGDNELVALDLNGGVWRYRVGDGAQLAASPEVARKPSTRGERIDCRADGTALVLDPANSPALIDANGRVTTPPEPIESESAAFAPDGSVWAVHGDGVTAWNGKNVSQVLTADHALSSGVSRGVYVEYVYESKKAARDGLWMVRDGARIKLPGGVSMIEQLDVAPDGAVALADEMMAFGWVVKGNKAGKRIMLLDQSGTRIDGVAVTNKWFVVADAGGNVWTADRPKMVWGHIEKPCGEYPNVFMAMAVANDDNRIAVACAGVGIRIYDINNNRLLTKDHPNSGASRVVWSPSGEQVATTIYDTGPIRIWRGSTLVATIDASPSWVWWSSETELVGSDLTTWTIPSGVAKPPAKPLDGVVARSPHGELVSAHRAGTVDVIKGASQTTLKLPATTFDWIDGVAIDDAGTHAVVWRGQYNGEPGTEVVEIDLTSNTIDHYPALSTAVAIGDGFVVIADPTGELNLRRHGVVTKLGNHGAKVTALAVHRDVVVAGGDDGKITLWSTDGKALGALTGHGAPVTGLAFAPDGNHLASTATDGTLQWDLTP